VTGAVLLTDNATHHEPEESSGMVLGTSGEKVGPGDPAGDVNQFSSLHGAGVNFLFADGHVSFLSSSMDYQTFQALSTRAGGEVITGDN
jgi:prepilin-type processing-associated H-X9-DG protein